MIVNGVRAARRAWSRKWSFLGLFLLIFLLMVLLLSGLDLLPDTAPAKASGGADTSSVATTTSAAVAPVSLQVAEEPVKIEIKKIGLKATIANPDTMNVEELDTYLLKGAVRYPSSAELGVTGNVVLFGHSSYLPIVKNLAYKTFDEIQKLKAGDSVTVYSSTTVYTYSVRTVEKETASQGAIPLDVSGKVLTLATCNSFATKNDRFVVTADFVDSHLIGP